MGQSLVYHRLNCNKSTGKYLRCYQVQGDVCQECTSRKTCFDTIGVRRRILASICYPAFYRGHSRVNTPEYLCMMKRRKIWAEGSFAVMKREHNKPYLGKYLEDFLWRNLDGNGRLIRFLCRQAGRMAYSCLECGR